MRVCAQEEVSLSCGVWWRLGLGDTSAGKLDHSTWYKAGPAST